MNDRVLRLGSRVLLAVSLTMVGALLAHDLVTGTPLDRLVREFDLFGYVMATTFPAVGALIVHRSPRHPIGWIYVLIGVGMWSVAMHGYAEWGLRLAGEPPPLAVLASWVGAWGWFPAIGLFLTFALLLFPDGQLPSPRWRPVGWAAGAGISLGTLDLAIGTWRLRGPAILAVSDDEKAPGLPDVLSGELGYALLFLAAAVSVASLFVRMRRARGDERQQLKWVVYAGAVAVIAMVANIMFSARTVDGGTLLMVLVAPLIPLATGVAIARFRLYDIDLVLNRTVLFALLAGFITTVYVGVVVGAGNLAGGRTDEPNVTLSLFATAIVAAAFQPARQRARRIANRLVYGERATPYEVMADFSARMADAVSTDEVLPRMAEAAGQGVGAGAVTISVDLPTGGSRAFGWPEDAPAEGRWDHVVPVDHQGERIGQIAVRARPGQRLTDDDLRLLEDVAAQAGLALRTVALNAQLRARGDEIAEQADAIRASRQRIVAAQDEERRRMERDIHDGAQQQLVAMSVKVGLVGQLLDRDRDRALDLLDELGADAKGALESLRDLARGIFPPLLLEQGLVAALDSHVRKNAIPVTIVADPIITEGRLTQDVEVAVYFCCLEAMQNATKHAPGAPLTVRLSRDDDGLTFEIHDEGPGFDPERPLQGNGLQNMSDRVAALGGTLTTGSSPGAGTTVSGRIPLAVTVT